MNLPSTQHERPAPRPSALRAALARRLPPEAPLRVLEVITHDAPGPALSTPYLEAGAAVTLVRRASADAAPRVARAAWLPLHREAVLEPARPLSTIGIRPGAHELVIWNPPLDLEADARPLRALVEALTPGGALVLPRARGRTPRAGIDDLEDILLLRDGLGSRAVGLIARRRGRAPALPTPLRALDRAACVDRARLLEVFHSPAARGPRRLRPGASQRFTAERDAMLAALRERVASGRELDPHALALPSCAPPRAPTIAPGCDVLAILPHPDDESIYAGGTIARLVALGLRVQLVTLTGGEGGRAARPLEAGRGGGDSLARRRAAEWSRAIALLGIAAAEPLGFADFGKYRDAHKSEPVTAADALRRWGAAPLLGALTRTIRQRRPRALLSMAPDRDPNYSLHGHHLACGVAVAIAFHLAGDPDWPACSDILPWGPGLHRVLAPPHTADADTIAVAVSGEALARKRAAVAAHESQRYSTARLLAALGREADAPHREHLDLLQAREGAEDPFAALAAPEERA